MATWKTKISYGGQILFDGVTNEVAFAKNLPTTNKLMSGDIKVEYYKYSRLPDGYTELQWIKSTGSQFINMGFSHKYYTEMKVSIEAQKPTPAGDASYYALCGSQNNTAPWKDNYIRYNLYFSKWDVGSASNSTTSTISIAQPYIIKASTINSRTYFKIDNTVIIDTTSSGETVSNSCQLFNYYNNGGEGNCSLKMYYAQFYSDFGVTLIRNFVPAKRILDSAIGMFDLVNNVWYGNAGTGVFTAGPEIG